MIEFFIPSTPIAQGRPRFSNRGGFTKAYDPPKSADYKAWVKSRAVKAMADSGAVCIQRDIPLCVRLEVYVQRPKSKPKRFVLPTTKPDVDNFAKGCLDAITSICFEADQQITNLHVKKRYGSPGVLVMIWEDEP